MLILRLIVAVSLHFDASGRVVQNSYSLVFAALLTLSILIVAGLLTPFVAALGGTAEIVLLLTGDASIPVGAAMGPINSLVLLLLGPGAYSVDARLFGRRVLILHSNDTPSRR
ncbi:MAG: hypothetical protein WDO56_30010 [Gammaproteobacteria bacterium]